MQIKNEYFDQFINFFMSLNQLDGALMIVLN